MQQTENITPVLSQRREEKPGVSTTGISVVLPCYNEEGHIVRDGVARVLEMLEVLQVPHEIILVDDGSRNDTRAHIDQAIQSHPGKPIHKIFNANNLGRGGAVMVGLRAARYPVAGYLDIDLEIGSQYIPAFYAAVKEGADLVVAERIYKVQLTPFCLARFVLSIGYLWISHLLLGIRYNDTEAGYKFFRRDKVLGLMGQVQDTHWFWDTEVIARAHYAGWKIKLLPCLFLRRKDKKSSVRVFRDTWAYLQAILKFRRQMPCK